MDDYFYGNARGGTLNYRYVAVNQTTLTVLVLTDDAAEVELIQQALADSSDKVWCLEYLGRLADGLDRLKKGGVDAVLLDLLLPDGQGVKALKALYAVAPTVPILIVSDRENEAIAAKATQLGAMDHLLKEHLDRYWLQRFLLNAIERRLVEEALFVERERAQVTLNSIGDAVLACDVGGKVSYLNAVAERMTGWTREEGIGRPLAEVFILIDKNTRECVDNPLLRAMRENATVTLAMSCLLVRRDKFESAIEDSAAPIHDRSGQVTGAVIVFHDASAADTVREMMAHSAQHDFLTGLPNRMLLNDRIAATIALAKRNHNQCAVMFLDLDGFKHVNDSMGHPVGDQLLQSVARRLVATVRGSDTVSRQGGDEFVILLGEEEHAQDAGVSADKILQTLAAPHEIAGREYHITASIGISIYPYDGNDAESLVRCADTAMYHAKDKGRNNFQFFTEEMNRRAVEWQFVESNLRRALERREFVIHYQPQFNLATGAITGAEALIRWCHPERGLIPPAQFVPIAEECGLILPIGRWVLNETCRQMRQWFDAGLRQFCISVNVSAAEFANKNFLSGVRASLKETNLDPHFLELEMTETALMQNVGYTKVALAELKSAGVQLAIDDFGTGYSSLSYLRDFPIDTLKIDQSFVSQITSDSVDDTIICTVINMGRTLKQRVVAEGIESHEQMAFLREQRCAEGQGYYFSHPVSAEAFETLLRSENGRVSSRQMS